uniref:phosphoribosyltransferase-like protein n=1 Tax=Flavobacterium sp. TaxID=239 RepID=UPI004049757F
MSELSLKHIDELINNSKNCKNTNEFLIELSKFIISFLNILVLKQVNYSTLFDRELSSNDKRFISFCLLRVYSINEELFSTGSIKHTIIKFIKESTPEVFSYLKIDDKTENYKIEKLLSEYISNIERKIDENIVKDFSLQAVNAYKQNLLQTLNNKLYKPVINEFTDLATINKSFDKLFSILIDYSEGEQLDKYKNYNAAIEYLDKILQTSEELGTKYSLEYCYKPFVKIKEALVSDFINNPNSKPADLEIFKTEKKYPIIENVKHQIQLKIENKSTGFANETKVFITDATNIKLTNKDVFVGQIKTFSFINFEYTGTTNSENLIVEGYLTWINFNGEKCTKEFIIELDGQSSKIDWETIENSRPYDLEPVTNESEFIGRTKIINELKNIGKKVSSSYIFGQRRVGKTSIVKTIQSSIKNTNNLIIYLEAGDWNSATSPQDSMNDLGEKICKKIKNFNIKFKNLTTPNFNGSFSSISDFLDEVSDIDPNFQVLIILDEFDRISNELLYQGNIAQSFVLTIRSISNREQYGFILVGGEKLEYILSQWQEFNKFKPIRVDYFDKKSEWEDFKNLIKLPVGETLEITDQAIDYIYKQTSGNPYFTKKICIELFDLMVHNRDSHATDIEAIQATQIARDSSNIAATDFSHFWKDGIKEKEEKEEEISVNRRKVLLSLGQLLESNTNTTKEAVIDKSISNGLNLLEAEKTLDEFIQRKIIYVDNNQHRFVVKFFEDWLISNGLNKILTTFQEEQSIILRKQYEDSIKISQEEINSLTQSWPTYKNKSITTSDVRSWLEQFGEFEDQRIVFKILENIKFYSSSEVRDKMEDLFLEVRREIAKSQKSVFLEQGKRKRDDILVSYLDKNPVKSGPEYAKIFVEQNNIYKDNSTNPDKLGNKLLEIKNINAIVFIDDFIGSGNSIIENLEPILNENEKILKENNILIIIGVITGFEEAKHKILDFARKKGFSIVIKLLDPLNKSDKCFDNESLIYTKTIDRDKAKTICKKIGVTLEKKHPLGFHDCQTRVVFSTTCPNNSLPILWKETSTWKPLFKRG